MLDTRRHPLDTSLSPSEEWDEWLRRFPSIADQLEGATLVNPPGGLRRTGRIQRWISPAAGPDWALLPHTAGFIDPLNSTGIAHTLCGIERLARAFERDWKRESFAGELAKYAETVSRETEFIDLLIAGCYETFRDFQLFVTYSMLYFAMVTSFEHRRAMGLQPIETAFLGADQPERWRITHDIHARLHELVERPVDRTVRRSFAKHVCREIARNGCKKVVLLNAHGGNFGLVATMHDIDGVTFGLEIVAEEFAQRLFVLHHHDLGSNHRPVLQLQSARADVDVSSSFGRLSGSCVPVIT